MTAVPSPVQTAALDVVGPAAAEIEKALPMLQPYLTPQTQADADYAGKLIGLLAAEVKGLEEKRATITRPLYVVRQSAYEAHMAACELFKPAIEPRELAIAALKAGVGAFLAAERKKAQEALAAAKTAEAIAKVEAPTVPKGLSAKVKRDYKVVDFDAVPMKYKMVTLNHALLAVDVDAGVESIPGVEIEAKTEVRRTGARGKATK